MSTELHERARELEAQATKIRNELDEIYAASASDEGDELLIRMADRFRAERDEARRELAKLNAQLSSADNDWEARFRATEARFLQARRVVSTIVNDPLMARDRVQSALLLLNEKIRDFTP